jgi:hypothetical protein
VTTPSSGPIMGDAAGARPAGSGGSMSTRFPQAMVWDATKEHHIVVIVDRRQKVVGYLCAECDIDHEMPIEHLEGIRRFIKESTSSQVILWAEINE